MGAHRHEYALALFTLLLTPILVHSKGSDIHMLQTYSFQSDVNDVSEMTLTSLDNILQEETQPAEKARSGDLTEQDVDAIITESEAFEKDIIHVTLEEDDMLRTDDIASPYTSVLATSNVTNTTTNTTAKPAAKPAAEPAAKPLSGPQLISQTMGGFNAGTYKGVLKKIAEIGYCVALEIYDAATGSCKAGSSVISSVSSSAIEPAAAKAADVVPETEFVLEKPPSSSVKFQATTDDTGPASKAEALTAAKFLAGTSKALLDTGASLPAGSQLPTADALTVSKPEVTAKPMAMKEHSDAPGRVQVSSKLLALVFVVVALA